MRNLLKFKRVVRKIMANPGYYENMIYSDSESITDSEKSMKVKRSPGKVRDSTLL